MMRRYNTHTPQRSLSEDSERWKAAGYSSSDETSFSLKTSSGVLNYKSNDTNSYTDFLRVSITMLLAFNASEIDPEFKKVISKALSIYEDGGSFNSEYTDEEDDEDEDFVAYALSNAKTEAAKYEEAAKFASTLPESEEYKVQILSIESGDDSNIERILAKQTDLPPPVVHDAVNNNKPFVLPAEKAKEVYIQLRMLDVFVNISVVGNSPSKPEQTVKKSAAKTTSRKGSATRKSASRSSSTKELTGLEKLPRTEGIITNT